jgi:hypothetical protein
MACFRQFGTWGSGKGAGAERDHRAASSPACCFRRQNPTVVIAREGGRPSNHRIFDLTTSSLSPLAQGAGCPALAGQDTANEMEPSGSGHAFKTGGAALSTPGFSSIAFDAASERHPYAAHSTPHDFSIHTPAATQALLARTTGSNCCACCDAGVDWLSRNSAERPEKPDGRSIDFRQLSAPCELI